ncbi:MAG: aminotransferase class V-fold PLP-dependent enzyme [Acidobacteria bacterium]|nr:aminotransferase class V-fold PLP-dependent enzyme [Acidobacteriota bacterium]
MDDLVYLDNAATTFPKPEEVVEFMATFCRTKGVNPGRTGFDLALEAEGIIAGARAALARRFGGTDPDRLVFSHNVTDSLNLLINSVLEPGDHVVSTTVEHNSVLRPLYHHRERGVDVDLVPFDGHGFVDPEAVIARIRPTTRLVVMNHGSNVLGTLQPISPVGAACRERGVLFAVDAAQTAGVVPIDVAAMNIDVLCFTGHKSLYGPTGTGGMYVAEHVDIRPCRSGGTGVKSALERQPDEYPWRLEFGTLNTVGIAGLLAGQRWIDTQGGVEAIHAREMELWRRLREGMTAMDGVVLYAAGSEERHLPVLAFNIEGLPPEKTGQLLDVDHGIITRTGLHCAPLVHAGLGTAATGGTVRFSLGAFNTGADVDRALAALAEITEYALAGTRL